jgi:hypothetical protein
MESYERLCQQWQVQQSCSEVGLTDQRETGLPIGRFGYFLEQPNTHGFFMVVLRNAMHGTLLIRSFWILTLMW